MVSLPARSIDHLVIIAIDYFPEERPDRLEKILLVGACRPLIVVVDDVQLDVGSRVASHLPAQQLSLLLRAAACAGPGARWESQSTSQQMEDRMLVQCLVNGFTVCDLFDDAVC
jgi:hypothetical protein